MDSRFKINFIESDFKIKKTTFIDPYSASRIQKKHIFAQNLKKMTKILIIDDEAPIRRVLREILENEGYQVDEAANGMEALQHIKEQEFDAVFCDIKMPEMDGFEVLEAIRKESDVPVIMLSGHATNENAADTIKKGAFDFIQKPPDLNRLLMILRHALEKKT